MAGVPELGFPQAVASSSAHSNHGVASAANAPNSGGGFSEALGQAVAQANGHGAHGGSAPSSAGGAHAGNVQSSESHPQHFSIGGAAHRGPTHFQEKALGLRVYRQELLASNIANADTPGYKAVDIDFPEAAQMAMTNQGKPLAMAASASGHIAASAQDQIPPYPLKYHVPYQASADGNTVEMDVERQKMAENSLMHQFSLDRVSGHFKHLMELLQNLK